MTEPNFSAIRARLRYDSVDEFIDGYSRYVTAGGMFIPMTPAKLKPVGTTVRFQFVLGDGATALLGEGVVRQIRGLETEESDSPIGMLVKFTKLSQDSKILIDRIVALKEIGKLGVDIFADDTGDSGYSDADSSESTEHGATTGNYSLAELTASNRQGSSQENSDELGELFTDRTGRLEASELAGLGASDFGVSKDSSYGHSQDYFAAEKSMESAPSFQEWGPEPENEQNSDVQMTGSGELSLDLFSFEANDFSNSQPSERSSDQPPSTELSFEFDFEMSEQSEPAEKTSSAISEVDDIFGEQEQILPDFPEFAMNLKSESADISLESDSENVQIALENESEEETEDASEKAGEQDLATPHVVRETVGGLQIRSFDGSADESVDRDFEQFAMGSDDDVDSMFDDVFGDAFDGAFGELEADLDEKPVESVESDDIAFEDAQEQENEIASDVSEEVVVLSNVVDTDESVSAPPAPPAMQPTLDVSDEDSEDFFDISSEESVAALLFGEESESFSIDENSEEVEDAVELAIPEPENDALEVSAEFDAPADVGQDEFELEEPVFELSEIEEDVVEADFLEDNDVEADEPIVEDIIADVPKFPTVPVPAPPFAASNDSVETDDDKQEQLSENSAELLSLLGALEESEAEEDGLKLGVGLSLSHGLHDKSSPAFDDEPDSFSALLASAQKEIEARNATSEEDRQRDAIDDLLGDDNDIPLPPSITAPSPFAVPDIPEKRRKGFMSKLFGKD